MMEMTLVTMMIMINTMNMKATKSGFQKVSEVACHDYHGFTAVRGAVGDEGDADDVDDHDLPHEHESDVWCLADIFFIFSSGSSMTQALQHCLVYTCQKHMYVP